MKTNSAKTSLAVGKIKWVLACEAHGQTPSLFGGALKGVILKGFFNRRANVESSFHREIVCPMLPLLNFLTLDVSVDCGFLVFHPS